MQFPGLLFNLVYFGWYFISVYSTIQRLRDQKQMWKVTKYHHTCIVVAVTLILGFFGSLINATALILEWDDIWWQVWWLWDAFWQTLFLVSWLFIVMIWCPLPDNKPYHRMDVTETTVVSQVVVQQQPERNQRSEDPDYTDSDREDMIRLIDMDDLEFYNPLHNRELM